MKDSFLEKMDELNIEEEIRELIRKLWEHSYITRSSCEGHRDENGSTPAYVIVEEKSGDGWFEKNSQDYGLIKINPKPECDCEKELRTNAIRCPNCGAGVFGYAVYEEVLRRK